MTKIQRKALRKKIVETIDEMTSEVNNRESIVTIGGHTISRRLVYAGGSQWSGCGRDWDETESGWAWVVDGQYGLTTPSLFGFDGHNRIERQTQVYLQDGYDEQTVPEHDGRDPLCRAPGRVMIEIGRGILAAKELAATAEQEEQTQAGNLLAVL